MSEKISLDSSVCIYNIVFVKHAANQHNDVMLTTIRRQ